MSSLVWEQQKRSIITIVTSAIIRFRQNLHHLYSRSQSLSPPCDSLQAQRYVKAGGNLKDLPPPPPMDTSDYIQCPHCERRCDHDDDFVSIYFWWFCTRRSVSDQFVSICFYPVCLVQSWWWFCTYLSVSDYFVNFDLFLSCLPRFAEAAADRHIPKCKDIKSNKKR